MVEIFISVNLKDKNLNILCFFSLNRLLFVYNFAVMSNGMPTITVHYSGCHLPAEIVEVCLFGNKVDRCSVNLVVTFLTLENKY